MRLRIICIVTMVLLGVRALNAEFIFNPVAGYTNWYHALGDMDVSDMGPVRYKGAPALSGWTYGMRMTFIFNEHVALSMAYRYGKLESGQRVQYTYDGSRYSQDVEQSAYFHNAYGALIFPVSGYVKIFAGMSYEPVIMKICQQGAVSDTGGGSGRFGVYSARLLSLRYRPLVGLGFSVPFARYFGFTLNISAQYITGSLECRGQQKEYADADLESIPDESTLFNYDLTIKGWGSEIEPAFVGFINDSVWVVTGFRYRYNRINARGDVGSRHVSYTGLEEHMFGVVLSLVFRL